MRRLLNAIAFSLRVSARRPPAVVTSLENGRAAFVFGVPLVTVLGRSDPGGFLERIQARRSQLVYAPDRQTAVAVALRWRLDLARIRISAGGPPEQSQISRELLAVARRVRTWHSI